MKLDPHKVCVNEFTYEGLKLSEIPLSASPASHILGSSAKCPDSGFPENGIWTFCSNHAKDCYFFTLRGAIQHKFSGSLLKIIYKLIVTYVDLVDKAPLVGIEFSLP